MFTVTTCAPSAAISSEGLLSGLREKMPRRGMRSETLEALPRHVQQPRHGSPMCCAPASMSTANTRYKPSSRQRPTSLRVEGPESNPWRPRLSVCPLACLYQSLKQAPPAAVSARHQPAGRGGIACLVLLCCVACGHRVLRACGVRNVCSYVTGDENRDHSTPHRTAQTHSLPGRRRRGGEARRTEERRGGEARRTEERREERGEDRQGEERGGRGEERRPGHDEQGHIDQRVRGHGQDNRLTLHREEPHMHSQFHPQTRCRRHAARCWHWLASSCSHTHYIHTYMCMY